MLNFAIDAAKKGGDLALSYFKKVPKVSYKVDNSPVTIADRKTELLIKKLILNKFPQHGFIGEEFGKSNPKAKFQWVLDPIDGTKSFVRGIEHWGTLLALLENGKPIIGIYYSPATNEMFYCQKKMGTYLNGKRIYVSKVKNLSESFMVHSSINHFLSSNKVDNIIKIATVCQGKRGASDCNGINLLLKGKVDINISGHGSIWDYAAPAILTEEAGGKFTNFKGKFRLDTDTSIFSNGLLHKDVLKYLKP